MHVEQSLKLFDYMLQYVLYVTQRHKQSQLTVRLVLYFHATEVIIGRCFQELK